MSLSCPKFDPLIATRVQENSKTLASESVINQIVGVDELAMEQTLVSKPEVNQQLDQTLVSKPEVNQHLDQTLGIDELELDRILVSEPAVNKAFISESAIDGTGVDNPAMDQTLVAASSIDQTQCVDVPAVSQTLSFEPTKDELLVSVPPVEDALIAEPVIDKPLGGDGLPMDQNLMNDLVGQIMGDVSGPGWELDSGESSSSSSFKSIGSGEEVKFMAVEPFESAKYHHPKPPAEDDDVDFDEPDFFHTNGLWWHMHGYPLERPFAPHNMSHMHPWWGIPRRLPWMMFGDMNNRKKQEGNGYSLFQSKFDKDNPATVGPGLYNLGNTCFLNAILQCLTHTVPLVEGLRSYNHPKDCESDSERFCVFCALYNHIELAINSTGKCLSPLKIVENLNHLSSDFRGYQQEDAHELLQCLFDKLDGCCNDLQTNDSHETLVHRLFGGRLVSKLKCCNCGHCSDKFEPLIDLSLEIENVSSLLNALESFTKVEKIENGEPQFTCESCKEKVAVEKQFMVDRAPSIAAFHLKRFKNDGSHVEKIDKHVEFPLELDLKPYTSDSQNDDVNLDYNLHAIVVHSGFSPTSGHYFCFVRSAPDEWYRFDDSQVTRASESHVLSRDAYILFYAKKGTPWFSTFMEAEKMNFVSIVSTTSPRSVLETANQSSGTSPFRETNIISEASEEDKRKTIGLSFYNSKHEDIVGEAKSDSEIGKSSSPSPNQDDNSNGMDQVFDSSASIRTNLNEEDRKNDVKTFKLSFGDLRYKEEVKEAKGDFDSAKTPSLSALTGDKSVSDNMDHISVSSSIMETSINEDKNEENRGDTMEILRSLIQAKDDSTIETSVDFNHQDEDLTESIDFASSFCSSLSPVRMSRLSVDDCALDDKADAEKDDSEVEKKSPPSALSDEVGKSALIDSSSLSAKACAFPKDHLMTKKRLPCKRQLNNDRQREEAYKVVKGMSCSRRRSQLMAAVNNNREMYLQNKRSKFNELFPMMKDGPSNALNNPNIVSVWRHIPL